MRAGAEHDPEKCVAVFPKRSCSIKSLKLFAHKQKAASQPPLVVISKGAGAYAPLSHFFMKLFLAAAGQFLAVRSDGLGFAGISHALLHVGGLRRARERLPSLPMALELAGVLRERRAGGKR